MRGSLCVFVLAAFALFGKSAIAEDASWPDSMVLSKGSQSPDGKYGVLIPDSAVGQDPVVDYLADLKTRQKIAPIPAVAHYDSENHGSLEVKWTEDSATCLIVHKSRGLMEFLALADVSAKPAPFMTDLGARICKELASNIPKKDSTGGVGDLAFYSRFGGNGAVKLRALTESEQAGRSVYFQGAYSIRDRRWSKAVARPVTKSEAADISNAYYSWEKDVAEGATEDEQIAQLNKCMNRLLRALGIILPGKAQAKLGSDQKVWLQKRKAADGKGSEVKLLSERISELRELCWLGE